MTKSVPNHSLIGFAPAFDMKDAIVFHLEDFRDLQEWAVPHEDKLHAATELVFIHHLGFDGVPPVKEFLNGGLDMALDYFLGPQRQQDRRDEIWFEPLRNGLILGMLVARWDDVALLGSWVRADLVDEYYYGTIEPQIPQLYVLIAGSLCTQAPAGSEELEASIAKARTKRPRALLEAWRGARNGDQDAFDLAMKQSLTSFAAKPPLPPDDAYIGERIARDETMVCLVAMHRGLRFPDLPDELAARIVTRKSLGLDD